MLDTCARAVEIGLPSVAFTEHLDLTPWFVPTDALEMFPRIGAEYVEADSTYRTPAFDADAYLEMVDRCRAAFPSLRILTGLEIGEPHWSPRIVADLLAGGQFDRVLGSLHSLRIEGQARVLDEWFFADGIAGDREAMAVRAYLAEAQAMAGSDSRFEVFAHVDYLIRQIRAAGRDHDPRPFEGEYREMLTTLARSGRVLELNTKLPLDRRILAWWYDVGGPAVSFGSDAHTPPAVGHGFADASAMAEAVGFMPQADPRDFWRR